MPSPSPDTDKSAGLPVKRRPYSGNDADFEATLRDIATKIREGGRTVGAGTVTEIIG